jgi:hypothetical protein
MTQASHLLTNYTNKYKNTQYVVEEFQKPLFENRFFINKSGLIYNSDIIKVFKNIWVQNPQKFALDYYNDYDFYRIILLVNNIPSVFRFDFKNLKNGTIIAPRKSAILQTILN